MMGDLPCLPLTLTHALWALAFPVCACHVAYCITTGGFACNVRDVRELALILAYQLTEQRQAMANEYR